MHNKICSKCELEKSIDNFYKHCRNKDGHSYECKVCHKVAVRESRMKNHDEAKARDRKYYRKRYLDPVVRRKILDRNNEYNKTHTKEILAQARIRRFKKLGKPFTPKPFVFYRDVIAHWMKQESTVADPKWKKLLSLPLTAKQRVVVELAIQGVGVAEAAVILKRQQSTITKTWNGNDNHTGGIVGKVRKYAPNLLENN